MLICPYISTTVVMIRGTVGLTPSTQELVLTPCQQSLCNIWNVTKNACNLNLPDQVETFTMSDSLKAKIQAKLDTL